MKYLRAFACLVVAGFSVPVATHGATITFQNDGVYTGTEDAPIQSGLSASNNFGSHQGLDAGAFGSDFFASDPHIVRGLIRFDVSALNGQFVTINSITLRLNVLAVLGANTVELFQPVSSNGDWVEGNSDDVFQTGTSSWNNKVEPGTAWTSGVGLGTLGYGGVLASNAYSSPFSGQSDFVISNSLLATVLITDFLTGSNEGFLLKATNEALTNSNVVIFTSSEVATVSQHPQLIIDYTPTPEPSSVLLLTAGLAVFSARRTRIQAA